MQVTVNINYNLVLTPSEFNLISKALRDTLKEEEKERALNLQIELQKQRVNQFQHYISEMEKLKNNLGTSND